MPAQGYRDRVDRLIAAIADVAPFGHPAPLNLSQAGREHRQLFRHYLADLKTAYERAQEWWNGLIKGLMKDAGLSREEAERAVQADSPLGPADDSDIIATIRRYWLECAKLNGVVPALEQVPPEQFVLGWLVEDGHDTFAELISRLTYFPVGLDQSGNWV
jgi:hypothetical protein